MHRCTGSLVYRVTGASGSLVHWVTGAPGHWCTWRTGSLVHRVTGSPGAPVHWITGAPGHWCIWVTGAPGYWCTGLLVHMALIIMPRPLVPQEVCSQPIAEEILEVFRLPDLNSLHNN